MKRRATKPAASGRDVHDGSSCGVIGGKRRDACVYRQGHDGPHFNGYDVFEARPRNTKASKAKPPIASSAPAPRNTPVVRGPQLEAFVPSSYVAPSSWTPPPARSRNQREGDLGNKLVVSFRLPRKVIERLDDEVQAAAGSYPPITRNELVRIAIDSLLVELARERGKEAA